MKLAGWKRALLAGLLTLSVAGGTFAPMVAGPAAAGGCWKQGSDVCCPAPNGRPVCFPD
jgi:hypothetical protein